MTEFDLLIRGATPHGAIGIADGKIAALSAGTAGEELDATGLLVLPGAIDAHVHFNEPGRADWEGIATGSRACAAGGTTAFFDMPLNSTPPVIDAKSFREKRGIAERKAHVDFALWGGLVPGNLDHLEALRDCGVVGLKAFMSNSGIADFPSADSVTLRAGMRRAAALGLIVAVHAEVEHPELRRGSSIRDYLASRPIEIELEAIRLALDLAGESRCPLHIVHVSSAAGVRLIAEARAAGADVTCETCPHYLVLNDEDVERLGAIAKCAPPIRSERERLLLLDRVNAGDVQTVGSDHSPSPSSMKTDADFFKVWGGISGCQHLLPLLLGADIAASQIAALTSANPASRFRIFGKGAIAVGMDADLALVELGGAHEIRADELHYRHHISPYVGRKIRARVRRTILRGQTVCIDGSIIGVPSGRILRPT